AARSAEQSSRHLTCCMRRRRDHVAAPTSDPAGLGGRGAAVPVEEELIEIKWIELQVLDVFAGYRCVFHLTDEDRRRIVMDNDLQHILECRSQRVLIRGELGILHSTLDGWIVVEPGVASATAR